MKGLFYCQHLAGTGIGHLVRSLNICRSLVKEFDIDFIQGGTDAPRSPIDSGRFRKFMLPPIAYVEGQGARDPSGLLNVSELLAKRRDYMLKTFNGPYDFFITEHFPFGRFKYISEIMPVINHVKSINPRCLIISSARDTMNYIRKNTEDFTCGYLHKYFNHVLVNSDPSIIKLEETFSRYQDIKDMVHYTGFVTEPAVPSPNDVRQKIILASVGGNPNGAPLVRTVVETAPLFPDYQFHILIGDNLRDALKNEFAALATNILVSDMIPDFEKELSQCALSISLGGYNTVMNVIHTRTPAIVCPLKYYEEQQFRAKKFAAKGLMHVIYPPGLNPAALAEKIEKVLSASYPSVDIDLNGAENCRKILSDLLGAKS